MKKETAAIAAEWRAMMKQPPTWKQPGWNDFPPDQKRVRLEIEREYWTYEESVPERLRKTRLKECEAQFKALEV